MNIMSDAPSVHRRVLGLRKFRSGKDPHMNGSSTLPGGHPKVPKEISALESSTPSIAIR